MSRPNEKKIYPPAPILNAMYVVMDETDFDFNTLVSIALLNFLWGRGRKHTKVSLEKFVENLKKLRK